MYIIVTVSRFSLRFPTHNSRRSTESLTSMAGWGARGPKDTCCTRGHVRHAAPPPETARRAFEATHTRTHAHTRPRAQKRIPHVRHLATGDECPRLGAVVSHRQKRRPKLGPEQDGENAPRKDDGGAPREARAWEHRKGLRLAAPSAARPPNLRPPEERPGHAPPRHACTCHAGGQLPPLPASPRPAAPEGEECFSSLPRS